jgi:hypothetical protein
VGDVFLLLAFSGDGTEAIIDVGSLNVEDGFASTVRGIAASIGEMEGN